MKFNLEKKDIDSALLSLSAVADKKQTLPVLSNILIKAQENGLNMLSTDLEIELEMDVENVVVEEPGEITIPAKKASDIVKELPDKIYHRFSTKTETNEAKNPVLQNVKKLKKKLAKYIFKALYFFAIKRKLKTL